MAESVRHLLQSPLKGCFMTIHVEGQSFGEVEQTFYEEFKEELAEIWVLYDSNGLNHSVTVTYDDDEPKITEGWMALRDHYQFVGHHEIFFKYLGYNQFQIIPKMNRITPDAFPTWHSESRALRKAVTYEMTMTEDPEHNPYLLFPDEMGHYLADTSLHEVFLVGTNQEKQKCYLDYQDLPLRVIIEKGWPEFVGINGFNVGDVLCFRMKSIYENNMIFVSKK